MFNPLGLRSNGGHDKYPRISAKLVVNRQLPTNGLPTRQKRAKVIELNPAAEDLSDLTYAVLHQP
jgi:hypothetical protein